MNKAVNVDGLYPYKFNLMKANSMSNMNIALVPRNLDMTLFGDNADKVALILDKVYRTKIYRNGYGYVRRNDDFNKPVPINMKQLKEMLHENPAPILDMICHSKRHENKGTQPIEKVLVCVAKARKDVRSALYKLDDAYKCKAKIHKLQWRKKTKKPVFKHNKTEMDKKIADWSKNYQTVCEHITKSLSLEMNETECNELKQRIWDKCIQDDRNMFINERISKLKKRYPKMSEDTAKEKATALYNKKSEERIAKLDEKYYDRLLMIEYKFLEMENKDEMPIYNLDEQGRLHYYLTNMPEEIRPYIRLGGCKMVSYDIGTSQCVFAWIAIQEYIRKHKITLDDVKRQAEEIGETIKHCGDGTIPEHILKELETLKRKRDTNILADEMKEFAKLLSKDFYEDIMDTINWDRLPDGKYDRKKFKSKVLFQFLYGKMPSWKRETTMMTYFLRKFPAVYCVFWKMRQFTEICRSFNQMMKDDVRTVTALKRIEEKYATSEFPREMQRQEANMLYNIIVPQINQPLVTIHDSIIVQQGKPCDVRNIMEKAFRDQYQIEVRISCELW